MSIVHLMKINRKTNEIQYNSTNKRKIHSKDPILGLGFAIMLAVAACTGASVTAEAEVQVATLVADSNVLSGSAQQISSQIYEDLTPNDIVAAHETVLGNIYDSSLASVVQVRITQKIPASDPTSGSASSVETLEAANTGF